MLVQTLRFLFPRDPAPLASERPGGLLYPRAAWRFPVVMLLFSAAIFLLAAWAGLIAPGGALKRLPPSPLSILLLAVTMAGALLLLILGIRGLIEIVRFVIRARPKTADETTTERQFVFLMLWSSRVSFIDIPMTLAAIYGCVAIFFTTIYLAWLMISHDLPLAVQRAHDLFAVFTFSEASLPRDVPVVVEARAESVRRTLAALRNVCMAITLPALFIACQATLNVPQRFMSCPSTGQREDTPGSAV